MSQSRMTSFNAVCASAISVLWIQTALAQIAPAAGGLEADAGRGILTERTGVIETQQTCPQRVGDAWDVTSESAWNILEIGIQVSPEQLRNPKFQVYTRYTCDAPFDRPRSEATR
ncbi:MAG: hypothetical protein EOP09_06255 [Proteobacteria bacterium]|nr:MAG: hypothetical protein EOP09_06255 [Pseudomonadota bacterium]